MSVLFFLLFLPILFFLLLKNKEKSLKGFNLPPSPPKLPIIGNLHQLGHLPHQSLQKLSQKHGPVMLLQLGSRPTLVVSSAEAAKDLLKTHDLDCCNRPPSPAVKKLSYNYPNISFAPNGHYWKEMRAIFISELVSIRVKSFAYAREAQIDKLISTVSQDPAMPVSLDQNMFSLAVGIIGTVAFGNMYGTNLFKSEEIQTVITDVMNMVSDLSVEDLFPSVVGRFVDALIGVIARREKSFQKLDQFFELVLEKHLDPARPKPEMEHVYKFMTAYICLGTNLHLFFLIISGRISWRDQQYCLWAILWAMSELIKNPRVMKKVQSEIRSCIGKKSKLDDDDVAKLKYLKMVVKETFRLHSAFPLLGCYFLMRQVANVKLVDTMSSLVQEFLLMHLPLAEIQILGETQMNFVRRDSKTVILTANNRVLTCCNLEHGDEGALQAMPWEPKMSSLLSPTFSPALIGSYLGK
ncbi:hypothetical protein SLEP1_g33164 [Rubroshorea leprosula]|uniref:Cytochrome P450 n=1 Tax=Rubroshorea leprosula TaxID=152421 RepID=A0AAV5KFW3_9ROSI|nr:hypothetical protein SLEP1_g33164 [Rubroshorea leprosula]